MCEICKQVICPPRCPNFYPDPIGYCDMCGSGILPGEKYVERSEGELCHVDCLYDTEMAVNWLGYEVKVGDDPRYDENGRLKWQD